MDDLAGLNWSAPNSNPAKPAQSTTPAYPSLRPTPSPFASGRNTPLSTQGSGTPGTRPPPTSQPAQDSFGNLLNFGPGKGSANLSLRERQDQLEAEKRRKEEERRKQAQAHYGDGSFLESLGRSQSASLRTPSPGAALAPPPAAGPSLGLHNGKPPAESDDDLFAAFNASTKVDNSSHFPPPALSSNPSPANAPKLDLGNPQSWNTSAPSVAGGNFGDEDDDDPFGLNQLKQKKSGTPSAAAAPAAGEDDDFLGDLGKPVDQVKKVGPTFAREPEPGKPIEDSSSDSEVEQAAASDDPFDKAVAQLVDYGFTPENARRGLTESGAGLDVQAAVNWLLDDAHRQAKEQAKGRRGGEERAPSQSRNGTPSWARDGPQGGDGARSRDNRSPASTEGDFAKTAAAVGTSFLKTANSLWKTGQKKVQKAVADFQQDGDPNQPKWMRAAGQDRGSGAAGRQTADVTDEALMLESGGRQAGRATRPAPERHPSSEARSRDRSPALPTRPGQGGQVPKWQQASQPPLDARSRLSRQAAEEESFQAYVSPARRKKTTPQPPPETRPPPAEPEPDLLFGGSAPPTSRPTPPVRSSQPSPASRPAARHSPARSPAPAPRLRQIPPISPAALQTSTKHRLEGTAHFKRGDFAAAYASYTSSLAAVPPDHPLAIVLLCNRALTALKTGEPRQAVEDADTAVRIIGPGKGEGEQVAVPGDSTTGGGGEEKRDMRDLYGKALSRKAEALEQMEKWADAAAVWQLCVEAGRGGATAAAGRLRCQKALTPKPPASTPKPTPRASPGPSTTTSRQPTPARPRPTPTPTTQKSSEAVARLRAAHQAAEREGDEKIALTDRVDARVAAWRDGKRDNLRALLGSLDAVLWEGSGWKKVGLHELVVAGKVKVVYMRAIAKTHPDKIAQDATTEVRMIAGTVFSTLNEAWDKFKAENNM